MDPNETLRELRESVRRAQRAADGDSNDAEIEAWQEAGEKILALDEWLSRGGFLPDDWAR